MKKYYLHSDSGQQGPYSIEELRNLGITKDTPIWFEGIPDWTPAIDIEEINHLFSSQTPPPYNHERNQSHNKKKTSTGKIVIGTILALFLVGGGLWIWNLNANGGSGGSYYEQVMTIEETEKAYPTRFLSADGTYKENFWGNKFKVKCKVKNSATVATYKDVVVKVTYYSKTESVIGSNNYTLYEIFPPHSTKTIELSIDNYKDVKAIGWEVIAAKPK